MPNFLRVKGADGHYTMVEVPPQAEVQPIAIVQPADATLRGSPRPKRYKCKPCGKLFAGVGVMSIHFARQHKELVTTQDSWRTHMETLDSGANGQ